MPDFSILYREGHEQLVYFSDPNANLKAIVAIHSTVLGPALGGTRMWPYESEQEAITDVLRLSRGMTYKAAISGLNLGGGKGVIIGDPKKDKTEILLRSYGRFLESLGGRYITAADVNIGVKDIEHIFTETSFVVGISRRLGGAGNPSPYTAKGVFRGMEASCTKVFEDRSLEGKVVAIQGVGSVGRRLGELLHKAGAVIFFTDVNSKNIDKFKEKVPVGKWVEPQDIYSVDCDIYAPCALGATINDKTIEQIKCKIVCGAANNQLAEARHGEILREKNITYAPDYLINAGGLMNVSIEFEGWTEQKITRMIDTIFDNLMEVFKISAQKNITTAQAADILAENRLNGIKNIHGDHHWRAPWERRR